MTGRRCPSTHWGPRLACVAALREGRGGSDRVAVGDADSCTEPASGHASSPFLPALAPPPPAFGLTPASTLGAPQQGESRQVTRSTPGSRGVDFTFFPSVCRCNAPSWAPVGTFTPLPCPLTPNRRWCGSGEPVEQTNGSRSALLPTGGVWQHFQVQQL